MMKRMARFAVVLMLAAAPLPAAGSGDYDVIVVGAGGGGLAAGARLARGGMKVLVLEQHSRVGGYMSAFMRGDYRFEVSLHGMDGLSEQGLHSTLFEVLGISDKVEPVRIDPMYKALFPDFTLTVPADRQAYLQLLKERFPYESDGIDTMVVEMDGLYNAMCFLVALYEGNPVAALQGFNAREFALLLHYRNWTLSQLLDRCISDQQLQAVLTQLVSYGGGEPDRISLPFFAMYWNSFHQGGFYYFRGGSQAVADALAEVITENGGTVLTGTRVERIIMKNGRAAGVRTATGEQYTCRYIVSNVNAPDTFKTLIGVEHLPARFVARLEGCTVGISWFQVYLGVDCEYGDVFPAGTHEIVVNEVYDQAQNFSWFRTGVSEKVPFFIMNYTLPDKETAPAGKNVIVLSTCMPYDWNNDWHEFEDYSRYTALKHEVADVLIQRAADVLPGLADHIEVIEVGSPRTMEHYTRNPGGAILGWEHTPDQVFFNRLPQQTPVPNVVLAGAWTFPCGGQSAVLESGRLAAETILRREKPGGYSMNKSIVRRACQQ